MAKSYSSIKAGWKNPNSSSVGMKKSYKDIMASDYDFGVDERYISSFINDSQNFMKDSQANYDKVGYSDAKSAFERNHSSFSDLRNRANTIKAYLNANKGNIQGDYSSLMTYLNDYNKVSEDISGAYKSKYDYFSQWADEDAYNREMAYAKEQDEKVKRYSAMTYDELEAELKTLENSKKGNALTNFASVVYAAQQDAPTRMDMYFDAVSNQEHNEKVDYDIALIEKEKTNRKYKQIDELPGSVKNLVDELTVIDSTNDDEEFANKMGALLSGFTGGNNVNYNVGSGSERRGEIIRELESMGVKNWQELLDYNKLRYNEEKNASTKEEYAQMAKEHPVLSSFVSIPASLGKGIGTLEMLENIGSDVPLDPNSPYFGMNDLSNTIRETVMYEHNYHLNTGIEAIDNIDINDEIYSLFMSTGDSVMAGLGGMGVKGLGGSVLGLSAASDAAQEVAERGGSSTEAITTGLVSGMNEMLWESLSLGKLDDLMSNGVKKRGFVPFVKELLKSMGINASEEFNTEASNLLADYLINGGASTYAETVQNYLSAGYTHDEAKKLANKDMLSQMAKAGVSGALQGLMMGSGGIALNYTSQGIEKARSRENLGRDILKGNNIQGLLEEAQGNKRATSLLNQVADKVAARENGSVNSRSARKVGRAYEEIVRDKANEVSSADKTALRNIIKQKFTDAGVADIDKAMAVTEKKLKGSKVTEAEQIYFDEIKGIDIVNSAMSSVAETNRETEKIVSDTYNSLLNMDAYATSGNRSIEIDATGESVEIKSIVDVGNNKVAPKVKLSNDTEVSLDELNLDKDTEIVFEGIRELADEGLVDSATASIIYDTFSARTFSPNLFVKGVTDAIRYGRMGAKAYFNSSSTVNALPQTFREALYDKGQADAQKETGDKQKKFANAPKKEFMSGKVTFDGVDYNSLDKKVKAQVDLLSVILPQLGINVEFFESPIENGVRVGENGAYKPSTNQMRIDIAAGNNGEGLLLFTASHELTHFIKAWSPTGYKKFAEFLVERYAEKGVDVEDLIQNKINNSIAAHDRDPSRKVLTRDEAYEEVVCDACESFLRDGDIAQQLVELAKEDKNLADKIKEWLKKFIDIVKNALDALQGIDPQSTESKKTLSLNKEAYQELISLWESALWNARDNTAAQKNTTIEGDVKNQARNNGQGNAENFVEDKYFGRQIEKFEVLKEGGYITVGKITKGSPLNMVGIPDGNLYFDVSKVIKEMKLRNDAIPSDKMKEIPKVLDNPIVITEYVDGRGNHSANVYGKLYIGTSPVVIGVMIAKSRKGNVVNKIQTVHPNRNVLKEMEDDNILYMSENKKETKSYFQALGTQKLPLGGKRFGFIRTISQIPVPVKEYTKTTQDSWKFQDRVTPEQDAEYLELAKNPEKNEARLREMVDAVARANGYTIKAYHATNAKFTAFDVDKTSDINYHGKGIYFTNSTRDVENNYENYEGPDPWNKIEARAYELASEKYDLSYEDTLSGDIEVIDKINECYDEAIAEFKSTIHRITAYLKFDNPFVLKKGGAFTGTYDMSKHDGVIDEQVYENIGHSGMDENTVHYVVRNPRNIKSADLVTYDDNGNIIPLSERFNEVNKDIRYQDRDSAGRALTPEQVEFFKGSKVRNENGNLLVCYHGTDVEFDTFDADFISQDNKLGLGFYFKMGEGLQYSYEHPKTVYLNIENPLTDTSKILSKEALTEFCGKTGIELDYDSSDYDLDVYQRLSYSYRGRFKEFLDDVVNILGVDGIISKDRKTAVAFKSNQIKDIDNLTPTEDDDIHYQDRPYQPSLEDLGIDYKAENDKLKADVDRLNKMLEFQKTLTHGALFTKSSVDKVASLLMKDFGVRKGKAELSDKLNELYSFMASSDELTWDEIYERGSRIAEWINNSRDKQTYVNPDAPDILHLIRDMDVVFSEAQKAEAAHYAGGTFEDYRRRYMGNLRIVKEHRQGRGEKATYTLEELWGTLLEEYPEAIGQDIMDEYDGKAESIPVLLPQVIEKLKETESVLSQMDVVDEIRKIVEKIYDYYWNVTTLHTLADKHQKEINLLKSKHRAEMEELAEKRKTDVRNTKEYYNKMIRRIREDKDAKLQSYKKHVAEQRHKDVVGRNKTATKNKLKHVVHELDRLLNNGNKKTNVKDGMQDMVAKALILSDLLLSEDISAEDILTRDIPDFHLTEKEKEDIKAYNSLIESRNEYQARIDALEEQYGKDMPEETYYELVNSIAMANRHIKNMEKSLSGVLERERKRINATSVQDAIFSLSAAYESLKESPDDYIKSSHDEYISGRLAALKGSLMGVKIDSMTFSEVEEVYHAYKMVLAAVRNANKLFVNGRKEDFAEVNTLIVKEIKDMNPKRDVNIKAIDSLLEKGRQFTYNDLKPYYFFEKLGSETLKRIFFDELARAQRVYALDWNEAKVYMENLRDKYNYYSWQNETQTIILMDGRKVHFTMQELMSIYAYSKRPQAEFHMSDGGFCFNSKEFFKDIEEIDEKTGEKVKKRVYRSDAETPYRISEFELGKIKRLLGKERIGFVDEMQKYLSEDLARKGNSVARVLYGIDIFKEEKYFPLRSSRDFTASVSETSAQYSLKNSSFTKETVPHALNPIVLQGFDEVWAGHVNKMATYHSLVLPIDNMNKVLNHTEYINVDVSGSTQLLIRQVFGNAAHEYINNFIKDLNGGFSSDSGADNPFATAFTNFKKTAVGASMSTVIQQPTAIIRAMAMINPKYFFGFNDAKYSQLQKEMEKYAPITIIKKIGGFDAGGNRSAVRTLLHKEHKTTKDKATAFFKDDEYRKESIDDAMMYGATKADEIGWAIIWNAVKNEVKDSTTYMPGTEDFFKECGKRFDEVINVTQVYDSVLSRSGYMRSKNDLVKMSTAFMGEPTTSFNMLYNVVLQAKRGNISKGKATATISATAVSIILAAFAKSFIYALRDDDDDESYMEKYMSAFSGSLKEELFVPNMLPFVSDFTSMLQGWDVERTDMAVFKDVVDAFNGLDSTSKSDYRKREDLFGAIAALFGLPLKNVMRTGREIWNVAENLFDDDTATAESTGKAFVEGFVGETTAKDVNKALDRNNTDKANKLIRELVSEKIESGKTEKEAKASLRSSVTSYWKPKYLEAYAKRDDKEMARIRKLLYATGLYEDIISTCQDWVKNQ